MELMWKKRSTERCVDPLTVLRNVRVRSQTEIDLVARHILAAQEMIEAETNRAIMKQTLLLRISAVLPSVQLFRPPMAGEVKLLAVRSTIDQGDLVEHAGTDFRLRSTYMMPAFKFSPVTRQMRGEMEIEYETGQSVAAEVPASIQQAVLLLASHFYSNREAVVTDPRKAVGFVLPMGVASLIRQFRIPNVNISPNEIG